ncbi:phenylalanine 4-monooxygenase [Hasllibacter sp. MH4015]|uniref:phenylalanine 4-monooxygenase n=1 Tax=Hasllibacter sp. MH4015 TaxID=2854029 RepID=UPI001CD4DD5D|nr:phenylalanine 4-monooxygenase [Hasllibacter sp. MH4015]
MPLSTDYASKIPGPDGLIAYTAEERAVWRDLYAQQIPVLRDHACRAYLEGLDKLAMDGTDVPQVRDIDARLARISGAGVKAVDALIPQDEFSTLLKNRKFPMATFIRRREHFDYIEEPDIFHECFGHCPMLTNDAFCRFMEQFGALALDLGDEWSERLFRLFWFTVEFGVIREGGALKAFGAGIISSPGELANVVHGTPMVEPFDLLTVLRTPYRIDIVQPVYFEIESFEQLAASLDCDMEAMLKEAAHRCDLPARFEAKAA